MAPPKPQQKPVPTSAPPKKHGPARRVVVERFGNNRYRVVELTYAEPTGRKVLAEELARVPAEDEVRLWLENFLGVDRFGDSGL